jgi:hypothetical protein
MIVDTVARSLFDDGFEREAERKMVLEVNDEIQKRLRQWLAFGLCTRLQNGIPSALLTCSSFLIPPLM